MSKLEVFLVSTELFDSPSLVIYIYTLEATITQELAVFIVYTCIIVYVHVRLNNSLFQSL